MRNRQTREVAYRVRGFWPFPVDMLRYDEARAATPADQELIDKLSVETPDKLTLTRTAHEINLICPRTVLNPSEARWRSFCWRVVAQEDV